MQTFVHYQLLLLLKKVSSARLGESDIHPISPKIPVVVVKYVTKVNQEASILNINTKLMIDTDFFTSNMNNMALCIIRMEILPIPSTLVYSVKSCCAVR